ncbi:hypothetical protein ABDK00_002490 [Niabella insulamsoli]|uniref:hypothetical protein n=1 Tax=Niabella insulamsoli TaxID=3144874 RepID=UPI0031FD143A
MKKRTAFISGISMLFLLNSLATSAQKPSVQGLPKVEAGLGGFGGAYEAKLGRKFSIDLGAGIGGRYEIYNYTFAYIIADSRSWIPALYMQVNPRFYYNLSRRDVKGKIIANNSGNFFGLKIKVAPHTAQINPGALINFHWGLQRAYGRSNKWLFNTHVGLGYGGNIGKGGSEGMIYPSIDAKFAYRIF